MSRGHKGRCFRQRRRTKARKESRGERFDPPIRYKVPAALMPFLARALTNQLRASFEQIGLAITRYNKWAGEHGKSPVRTESEAQAAAG